MKRKIFVMILILSLTFAMIVCTKSLAAREGSANTLTQDDVNAIVEQKVAEAVTDAKVEMQTQVDKINQTKEESVKENESNGIGMIAAALATGLACIGSGIAVAVVASSAVGAVSEDPSLLGKTIIFAGLAEGIAIYGLIISIMILNKV